jgi:pimeloyl-[acyl-carrier protein] synthase
MTTAPTLSKVSSKDASLSLYQLLDPEVLANPYPLFHRLQDEDPVHWDAFLHAWVATRYEDVVQVLHNFSADRTPTPLQLDAMGLSQLNPIARVMVKQMLFMDAPAHTRLRGLASRAFTPSRVEVLSSHIREIVNQLLDKVAVAGHMDVIRDLAEPLPAIVTAEMLGVPVRDFLQLKIWSADFAEMLGNFQHNPDHAPRMLASVEKMTAYFRNTISDLRSHPRDGLMNAFLTAEIDGDRLTDEEVIANTIVTMVGGQETTTNLIGNGLLTLLRHPKEMKRLRDDLSLIPSAVEEMLRYESPSQHTARLAPSDWELGGKTIRKRDAVIAVMAAANRDPERFTDPDRFDITRKENRHLAFGYAAHFCFGAPLARLEGQIVLDAFLRRCANVTLAQEPLEWRSNLGLRGLKALNVKFDGAREKNGRGHVEGARNQVAAHREEPIATVSPTQQELIRRELGIPHAGSLYNECVTVRILGPLDVAVLERSFSEIVRRHELWRSTFSIENGQYVQVAQLATPVTFSVIDLREFPVVGRDAEAVRRVNEICRLPFQLSTGPLLRPILMCMGDAEHRLYLVAHLLVLDGMSAYQIFPSELASLYKAFLSGTPSPLPELTAQYADFSAWHRERVLRERDKQTDYWGTQLRGKLSSNRGGVDNASGAGQPFRGAIRKFALDRDLSARVKRFSRQENTTLFVTLLAGFAVMLQRWTNETDVVVGTLSACGRDREEFSGLLGYFLNPVALRLNLEGSTTFRTLLTQARAVMCEAIDHDDVPMEQLARELAPTAKYTNNPFFRAAMSLQPPMPVLGLPWTVTSMDVESGGSPWDLYVAFIDCAEGLVGRIQYNPDLIEAGRIERGVREFEALLEMLITEPERRLLEMDSTESHETAEVSPLSRGAGIS